MLKKFRNKENRQLATNFANFGVFQVFNYLVPLITIPYIVRIIGAEKFGIISIALAISYYFRIIVEYGFSITGVQLVAQAGNNLRKKSEIYSSILCIQTGFVLIGFIVLLLLVYLIEDLRSDWRVYLFTYGIVPANMLMALWFYIGLEKIQYLNYINFFGRLIYILTVFILIRQIDDYYLIPILNSGAYFFSGFLSVFIIVKQFNIRLIKPGFVNLKRYLIEGWPLFISNFGINLYRNTNVIILGLVANKEIVGLYSAGEKIIKAVQSVFAPITQTLFPYISRLRVVEPDKSIRSVKMIIKFMAIFSGTITAIIMLFSGRITVVALGPQFIDSTIVIRIGALVIFFGVLNYIIGIIFMTNFGLKKEFSKSVIITGIVNLFICYGLSKKFGLVGTALSFAGAEALLFLFMLIYIYRSKRKLFSKIGNPMARIL
ncbi:MAG: flippase [Fidelibacterota bacterium]